MALTKEEMKNVDNQIAAYKDMIKLLKEQIRCLKEQKEKA